MKHCDARSIAENVEFCRPIITELRQTQHTDTVQTTSSTKGSLDRHIDYEDYYDDDDDDDDDLEQLS